MIPENNKPSINEKSIFYVQGKQTEKFNLILKKIV